MPQIRSQRSTQTINSRMGYLYLIALLKKWLLFRCLVGFLPDVFYSALHSRQTARQSTP